MIDGLFPVAPNALQQAHQIARKHLGGLTHKLFLRPVAAGVSGIGARRLVGQFQRSYCNSISINGSQQVADNGCKLHPSGNRSDPVLSYRKGNGS